MSSSWMLRIVRWLLAVMSIVCVFSVVYHLYNQQYETETAIYATADESVAFQGVYVRDETPCTYSGQGAVCYQVSDGGKLGVDSVIAHIYGDESQIDLLQQISALQTELALLEKIQNPGTSESAQPANLSGLIQEHYKSLILHRERNQLTALESEKEQMLILMSTYQLITNVGMDFTPRINTINAQLTALQASQKAPMDTIYSDRSAYFVSYVDGYEDTLTKESIDDLTVEEIRAVTDDTSQSDNRVIGKLIDGYEWYIVGVIDNAKSLFETDMKVTFKFESTAETVTGVIDSIRATDNPNESIVAVRCDQLTHDLVQHRTERVEMIKGQYEGIKVNREAVRFAQVEETVKDPETGEEQTQTVEARGVYILLGEQPAFRRLDVIYEGSDYLLTSLNAGEGYVSLYDDIIVNGVSADGT